MSIQSVSADTRSHTIVFEGHEYWEYLWPSVIMWATDRCLRIVRLVYCNVHVRLSKGKFINVTESRMTYDEAADVIRLEVTPGMPGLQVRPETTTSCISHSASPAGRTIRLLLELGGTNRIRVERHWKSLANLGTLSIILSFHFYLRPFLVIEAWAEGKCHFNNL